MRKALMSLLLMAPVSALPCAKDEEAVPAEISQQGPDAILLYRTQKHFESADVVFEGTVISIEQVPGREWLITRAHIEPGRVWKSDRGDLKVVTTSATSCGANLKVGDHYIFLAARKHNFWSFLPWVDEPLAVGIEGAVWNGPYDAIASEDLAFHRRVSLAPLAKALNAPDILNTPSN